MAKKQTSKPVVVKVNNNIEAQIAKLRGNMSKSSVALAEEWASDESKHDAIRLAFKLLPKQSTRALVLSKRELTEYNRIAAISKDVAEQWKERVIAGKSDKRKSA